MSAAEDIRYRQSSQFRLWSFSPAQLAATREKTNSLARASISERLSTPTASSTNTPDPTDLLQPPQPQQPQQQQQQQLPEFLSPADEAQLLTFYTIELLRAGAFCKIPTDMRATAAVFLRRFYVTNSVMTYPPTDLLKTCLFFGCKAEGWYQSATAFADHFPNTTSEEILAGEFLLCQSLRFAFDVRHPFRALEGAIMELRRYGDIEDKRIASAHGRSREILKFSPVVTDAYFHYTPSQIMLAALSLADRGLADRLIHEAFSSGAAAAAAANGKENRKGGGGSSSDEKAARMVAVAADVRDRVVGAVEACREMLAREPPERMTEFWGTPESNKVIKPLRQKLKRCRDPDRWDLVALQKARREHQAAARGRKAGAAGGGDDDDDDDIFIQGDPDDDDGAVFGGPIGGGGGVGGGEGREPKRRKVVGRVPDDPFGGPL